MSPRPEPDVNATWARARATALTESGPGHHDAKAATMRTYTPRAEDVERDWYVVDATDQVLGRLATRVAHVLRGKHKPIFSPHIDVGDHVIVINAEHIRLSGDKAAQKLWHRHSGFPGGLKSVPFLRILDETPEKAVQKAITGMLPKNKLGRKMATKLRVYRGAEHPHEAQHPQPLPEF